MKKMVLWLGLPLLLMGADIDWNSDFVEAQAQAKKYHKPYWY